MIDILVMSDGDRNAFGSEKKKQSASSANDGNLGTAMVSRTAITNDTDSAPQNILHQFLMTPENKKRMRNLFRGATEGNITRFRALTF